MFTADSSTALPVEAAEGAAVGETIRNVEADAAVSIGTAVTDTAVTGRAVTDTAATGTALDAMLIGVAVSVAVDPLELLSWDGKGDTAAPDMCKATGAVAPSAEAAAEEHLSAVCMCSTGRRPETLASSAFACGSLIRRRSEGALEPEVSPPARLERSRVRSRLESRLVSLNDLCCGVRPGRSQVVTFVSLFQK
jgi:hypothetical protein